MKEGYRPYLESVESVLAETGSEAKGLSAAEAAARLEANGPNKLIEAKKRSSIARFFDQMKDHNPARGGSTLADHFAVSA